MHAETSLAEGRRIYMLCRTCGYMLEPLDKLCPRCHQNPMDAPPPPQPAPTTPAPEPSGLRRALDPSIGARERRDRIQAAVAAETAADDAGLGLCPMCGSRRLVEASMIESRARYPLWAIILTCALALFTMGLSLIALPFLLAKDHFPVHLRSCQVCAHRWRA